MAVACSFADYGCTSMLHPSEMDDHMVAEQHSHLSLVQSKFRLIEAERDHLRELIHHAQSRARKAEQRVADLLEENLALREAKANSSPTNAEDVLDGEPGAAEAPVPVIGLFSTPQTLADVRLSPGTQAALDANRDAASDSLQLGAFEWPHFKELDPVQHGRWVNGKSVTIMPPKRQIYRSTVPAGRMRSFSVGKQHEAAPAPVVVPVAPPQTVSIELPTTTGATTGKARPKNRLFDQEDWEEKRGKTYGAALGLAPLCPHLWFKKAEAKLKNLGTPKPAPA